MKQTIQEFLQARGKSCNISIRAGKLFKRTKQKRWSDEEMTIIAKYYLTREMTAAQISQQLLKERSPQSIREAGRRYCKKQSITIIRDFTLYGSMSTQK